LDQENCGMKFAGHTMGTPDLDIFGAIDLFADIGYDGIEVRVQTDGQLWVESYSEELGKRVRDKTVANFFFY